MESAGLRLMRHGPWGLPAVHAARSVPTPRRFSSPKRRRPRFHCFQITLRSRRRIHESRSSQVPRQFTDGHPVDAGAPLVRLDMSQCLKQVLASADFLHELLSVCRAFGCSPRRLRFGPFGRALRGFTPSARLEGQFPLVVLPLSAHENTPPTCRSRSFGPSSAVPGSAYLFAASFDLAVPQ